MTILKTIKEMVEVDVEEDILTSNFTIYQQWDFIFTKKCYSCYPYR